MRLLAPAHFRCHIAGVDTLNTPVSVILEWSKLLGVSVAKLTGGNWQKLAHPKGQLLVAHLRLPQDLAGKIWCWLLKETKVGGSNCFSSSLLNLRMVFENCGIDDALGCAHLLSEEISV